MRQTAAWPFQGCRWMSSSSHCNKGFSGYKEKGRSFVQPLRFSLTQAPARVEAQGEIRVKSLDEIRKEKAARSLGQGPAHEAGWCSTKGPSPAKSSATPPVAVHVKTSKLQLERKRKLAREGEEELRGRSEAPPEWDVPSKRAAMHPGEIRVKTLEEIRKEKAARMQSKVQEVKAEESPAPLSAPLKRRILRINRNMATGAVNGKMESLVEVARVKTSQEMMLENIYRSPSTAHQSSSSTEPLLFLAKDPPTAPQSSSAMLTTPSQPKSHHQYTATSHTSGSAPLNDFDELLSEFAEDLLDGEMELELDPAVNGDDLLLQLVVMIDS
ncbi:hypothetical protein GJAV_G00004270 [Gymnothorax javanicus]|nr:hypothetical protein GJAV_G00004270 [Gymnothorax javanicus]